MPVKWIRGCVNFFFKSWTIDLSQSKLKHQEISRKHFIPRIAMHCVLWSDWLQSDHVNYRAMMGSDSTVHNLEVTLKGKGFMHRLCL